MVRRKTRSGEAEQSQDEQLESDGLARASRSGPHGAALCHGGHRRDQLPGEGGTPGDPCSTWEGPSLRFRRGAARIGSSPLLLFSHELGK